MELKKLYQIPTIPRAILSNGEEREIKFTLSKDDEQNNIKGGKLTFLGYYADTLAEDFKKWLNGQRLCIDGGSGLCIENMREIITFLIQNRYNIEGQLRGHSLKGETPLNVVENSEVLQ